MEKVTITLYVEREDADGTRDLETTIRYWLDSMADASTEVEDQETGQIAGVFNFDKLFTVKVEKA